MSANTSAQTLDAISNLYHLTGTLSLRAHASDDDAEALTATKAQLKDFYRFWLNDLSNTMISRPASFQMKNILASLPRILPEEPQEFRKNAQDKLSAIRQTLKTTHEKDIQAAFEDIENAFLTYLEHKNKIIPEITKDQALSQRFSFITLQDQET